MMRTGSIFLALFGLVLAGYSGTAATAEPFSQSDTIYVYGRVADVHSVTVDANNEIIEIASNTTKDTLPRVFRDKISTETQIELTPQVYEAYLKLVPPGTSKVGIIYQRLPQVDIKLKPADELFDEHSIINQLQAVANQEPEPFI